MLVLTNDSQKTSVLAKLLVESWNRSGREVYYFFFDATSEYQKSVSNGLCAILHQLLKRHKIIAADQRFRSQFTEAGGVEGDSSPKLQLAIVQALELAAERDAANGVGFA